MPDLISRNPENGAVGVQPSVVLTLTFDESVQLGGGADISIHQSENDVLVESITVSPTNTNIGGVGTSSLSLTLMSALQESVCGLVLRLIIINIRC